MVISYISITLQVLTIQNFLALVFETDIGTLFYFQNIANTFSYKTSRKKSFFIRNFGFWIEIFVSGYIETPLISHSAVIFPDNNG